MKAARSRREPSEKGEKTRSSNAHKMRAKTWTQLTRDCYLSLPPSLQLLSFCSFPHNQRAWRNWREKQMILGWKINDELKMRNKSLSPQWRTMTPTAPQQIRQSNCGNSITLACLSLSNMHRPSGNALVCWLNRIWETPISLPSRWGCTPPLHVVGSKTFIFILLRRRYTIRHILKTQLRLLSEFEYTSRCTSWNGIWVHRWSFIRESFVSLFSFFKLVDCVGRSKSSIVED
jgi:hypothetical protein